MSASKAKAAAAEVAALAAAANVVTAASEARSRDEEASNAVHLHEKQMSSQQLREAIDSTVNIPPVQVLPLPLSAAKAKFNSDRAAAKQQRVEKRKRESGSADVKPNITTPTKSAPAAPDTVLVEVYRLMHNEAVLGISAANLAFGQHLLIGDLRRTVLFHNCFL
jgi:hypothetical protein